MLKVQEIRELIKLIDQSSIDEFTYEHDGEKIKMKKASSAVTVVEAPKQQDAPAAQPAPAPVAVSAPAPAPVQEAAPAPKKEGVEITSPMVGTFYAASSPDADPFVQVGSHVTAGSPVCIVEAMKLFNEIEAEVSGEIIEILVKDGQLVEYGQPLFLVKA